MPTIRIATWNLEWAKPGTERAEKCLERLRAIDPDVICLTESCED
ncbi:MAG: endonuclease/exonuclease/phosphatase family protein [Rubripirellula sp.]|nr:endonuclease/exonuclease/phosphatase family protein [Rubripirellula sp.]